MEGYVEIYKGNPDTGELIHSESNMVLDGAREHIAGVMTMGTFPSGLSSLEASGSLDPSNFNVKAMSIGAAEPWFRIRDSRYYPNFELSTTPEYANGVRYVLAQPYVENYNFSSAGEHTIRPSIDAFQLIRDQGFTETLGRDRSKNLLIMDYGGSSINLGKFRYWVPDEAFPGSGRVRPFGWTSEQAGIKTSNFAGYPDNMWEPVREGYSSSALLAIKPYGVTSPAASMRFEPDETLFPDARYLRQQGYTYRYEYDILKEFPGSQSTGSLGEGGTRANMSWLIWSQNGGGGTLPGGIGIGKIKSHTSDPTIGSSQRIRLGFGNVWAGSSILDNFKVFETHDANGDPIPDSGIWDIKTEGTPTVTQMIDVDGTSGLVIDSSSQGDSVILAHELRLEAGKNYRLRLESSGTDPIQARVYRMNDNLDFYQNLEWVDFTNGIVRTVSTSGFDEIPSLTINMDSQVKARTLEFTIPGTMDDFDAHPEFLDGISNYQEGGALTPDYIYVLELVIPSDKNDSYSTTFIRNCSLYDLNEVLSPNSEFNMRDSMFLNSDFEYRNKPGTPPANSTVATIDPAGSVRLGLVDLSGWTVYSPINDQLGQDSEVWQYSSTYGSVRYEASSMELPNGQTIDGFVTLRARDRDAGVTNARISQRFKIPDELFEGWYDGQSVIDKYKEPQLVVSWWERNQGAAGSKTYGSFAALRTFDQPPLHYHFSGDDTDQNQIVNMGDWAPKVTSPYYWTSGTDHEWKFHSRNIKIDPTICYKKDLYFQFIAGSRADGLFGDTQIHDLRLGVIPHWPKGTQGNPESYFYLTSANALGIHASGTFVGGNQNTQVPMVRTNVTGLRPDKKFYAIVKYKTNHATVADSAMKLCFTNDIENYEGATTGRAYKIDNSNCVGEWTDSSNPQNGTNAHKRLYHTNNKWVTSSIGPIYGMDNEGFGVSSDYTLTLMTDYSNADVFQAEIDYIRVVDSNFFAGSDLEPWQYQQYAADKHVTSEAANWAKDQTPYYGGWRYFNVSSTAGSVLTNAVRPYVKTDGTNSWMEWRRNDTINNNPGELRFFDKIKNMGLKAGENMAFSFDSNAVDEDDYWRWCARLFQPDNLEQPGTGGTWWSWDPDDSQWDEVYAQNFTNVTNMEVVAYPFQNYVTPPIRLPEEAVDDAILFLDFRPHKAAGAAGTHSFGNFKLYQTYEAKDVSSIHSTPPTPTDKTLQASSDGPGKQGHFLNYLEFSSYDSQASALNLEQILQHGCFLPGSGIVMASSTFDWPNSASWVAGDASLPNTYYGGSSLSGILSGVLNGREVVNSDGFIYENPKSLGQRVNGGGFSIADSSAGFIASGIGTVSSTREIKYILTLSSVDWKFLDYYYGGIGSIGLWAVDREATTKKLYGDAAPTYPLWSSATGDEELKRYDNQLDSGSLYNMTDPSTNPVFKLLAKKTFLPGGLKIPENPLETDNIDDYLTIIWSIKF